MPQLIVTKGLDAGRPIPFVGEVTLGRNQNNDIVLDDPGVSQHHAILRSCQGGALLSDRKSRNGTWHRDERITEVLLRDQEEFSIGGLSLRLVMSSPRPTLAMQKSSKAGWMVTLLVLVGISTATLVILKQEGLLSGDTPRERSEVEPEAQSLHDPRSSEAPVIPPVGSPRTKYFGRVADPTSGAAVVGARVEVLLAGSTKPTTVFSKRKGETHLPNPVLADAGGRYGFYVADGRYRLRVFSPANELLYDLDDVMIADPRNPRTIVANKSQPALSLNTPPTSGELNLPLMVQKRDQNDRPLGARWRFETHNTEVGWGMFYNFRRRGGLPDARDLAHIDSGQEPVMTWGANDADDGIFTIPGFYLSGGGLWLGDAHIATFDLRLPVPDGDDASGVAIFMNAPEGLTKGDVVALDPTARLSVKPAERPRAKVPFVVAKVDDKGRTFVLVRGLAWAKVTGAVMPGDYLVTSTTRGHAQVANDNTDPSRSLGVAVSAPVDNKVLVRISRVAARP